MNRKQLIKKICEQEGKKHQAMKYDVDEIVKIMENDREIIGYFMQAGFEIIECDLLKKSKKKK